MEKAPPEDRTKLSRLMGTPGRWIKTNTPLYRAADGLLSATFAHLLILPKFPKVIIMEANNRLGRLTEEDNRLGRLFEATITPVDRFLVEQLEYYDPAFLEKALRDVGRNPKIGIGFKLINRFVQRRDLLGAYEAFWSTVTPAWGRSNKMLYRGLGGDKNPTFATIATMSYSGFMHVFDPMALPMWLITSTLNHQPVQEFLPDTAFNLTKFFFVLGLPIVFNKYFRRVKKDNTNFVV